MNRNHTSRNTPSRRKNRGGTILGMLIGLVVGVLIAAGVVWYMNKMPLPFQTKGKTVEKNDEAAKPGAAPNAPAALPGKPGDKVGEKPRFEFYKILPGAEEAAPQPAQKPAQKAEPSGGELLYLQVAALQNPADADNLKARLALMGVEAGVQQVNVPDKGIMHRVRTGPYRSPEEMAQVRALLAQNGIPASVVKVKDGAN